MFNKFYQRISVFTALCVCFEVYKLTPVLLVYCGYLCFRSGTCGAWDVTMRAERSACVVRRRNKPRYRQNAFIRRFSRKLCDISLPFEILRRLNAPCTALCLQDVVYAFSIVEISPGIHNSQ